MRRPSFSLLAGMTGDRTAIISNGRNYSYADLLDASARVAAALLGGEADLGERRVAFLVPPGFEYAAVLWGIWRAGGIAVPLCNSHPRPELEYAIGDSRSDIVLAPAGHEVVVRGIAGERGLRFLEVAAALKDVMAPGPLPDLAPGRRALMLYTSGTTNRPKGVVTTHANIEAQVGSLVEAWEWSADDYILHFLPLHHIHGVINILSCALWAGARCRMLPRFDAGEVWNAILREDLTLFMAVPTIYVKLIAAWEAASAEQQRAMSAACGKLRLMVSGSAALPVPVLEKWRSISGHTLLERYGMTEIGMGLSNPLHGERVPGHVGAPLPGVEARIVDDEGSDVADGAAGELWVRGPGVFQEYWDRPEATRDAFRDGWFRTGDVALFEAGGYRLLGRSSVDIIKTGGYKVSALEIEEVLLAHPDMIECAVVGVEDPEWGERVGAAIVVRSNTLTPEALRSWAGERLARYKLPTRVLFVDHLPRNAMGKVQKTQVANLFNTAE